MAGGLRLSSIAAVAMAAAALACARPAASNPVGPTVANGQASFQSSGATLSIVNTPGAIINWQRFSIGSGETTRFVQQSAASAVLNRVVGGDPSRILGALQSNGRVFLINPSGIVFGPTAQIDVGGLVASSLNISNADFIAGRMNFAGDPARAAPVVNLGSIAARPGGGVYLIGSAVDNQGVITAPNGDVVLAAGQSVRVTESPASGIQVEVKAPADRALNLSEALYGVRGIYGGLVRNSGVVNANSAVRGADGRIVLKASGSVSLEAGGTVTASGPDGGRIVVEAQQGAAVVAGGMEAAGREGRGGTIAVTGSSVRLADGASVDASGSGGGGTVLIGGDLHGAPIRDGEAALANSQYTDVAPSARIRADAKDSGDGGRVVVWADRGTRFYGTVSARGGAAAGNGGAVEVSGKETLVFKGKVDTRAPRGVTGTLLLDPASITILDGANDGDDADGAANSFAGAGTPGTVAVGDATPTLIYQSELEGIAGTTNISLAATNSITISPLSNHNLNLAQGAGHSASFQSGSFAMDAADTITTAGGALNITTTTGGAAMGSLATNGGAVTLDLAGASTVAGAISGAGTTLTKQGAGTLTLAGASTYTGTTTVGAGTLALGAGNALPAATTVVVNGTGTLDIGAFDQSLAGVQLVAGAIAGTTGTLTSASPYDLQAGTVSAILGGGVGLTKSTAGTVTLSGANTYTGATAVNAGVLNLRNATATGTTAGGVSVASGAALEVQNGISVGDEALTLTGAGVGGNGALRNVSGSNSWGGTITLTGGGATIQSDAGILTLGNATAVTGAAQNVTFTGAGNVTVAGAIATTTGSVTQNGTGTVVLGAANSYTGTTAINSGTLAVTANDALGTAASGTTVAAGATLDLQNVAYTTLEPLTLNGGTVTASTGTSSFSNGITLTASSGVAAASGAQLTLSGAIGGAGLGITKTDVGTVTLSGDNLYTGTTTVSAGTLALGASDRLNDASSLVVNGGTFSMGAFNETVAGVRLAGGAITGTTGVLTSASNYDLQAGSASAILIGGVGAVKSTGGTVTLSGVNTYTGPTTINGGILSVGLLANGGAASNIGQSTSAAGNLVLGGGTLQYTGGTVAIDRNFTLTAGTTSTIDVTAAGTNLTLNGAGAATNGSLAKAGGGTLTLSGDNLYAGTTTVTAGTLALGASDRLNDASSLVVNGGAFSMGAFNEQVAGVRLAGGGINGTTGLLTSTSNYDLQAGSASAILTGSVGAVKTTTSTVTLSGVNTYTGATTINAGILSVGLLANGGVASNIGQSTSAAGNLVLGGGTLQYTGGTVAIDRNFTLTAGTTSTIDVTPAGTNLTLTGAGAATNGSLTKVGAGTLTLSGASLYTGTTTVNAGTLAYGTDNALASGPVTVNGGTWNVGTFSDSVGTVTLVNGAITGTTGVITGTFYDVRNGSISAILAGGAALTKTTSGTVTLSGANTYAGTTTVSDGRLVLGASNVLDDATHLVVSGANAVFDVASFNDTVAGVQLVDGTITGTSGVLTSKSDFDLQAGTVSAIIDGFTPAVGVVKSSPGTVTLTRANLYAGATAVNGGTLAVTSDAALGVPASGTTVEPGATLDFQNVTYTAEPLTLHGGTVATSTGTSSFAGDTVLTANSFASVTGTQLTMAGAISESGGTFGVTKVGAGTLVLSGVDTYKGATTVFSGTVALGASDRLDDASNIVVNGGIFDVRSFNELVSGVHLISGTITGTSGILASTSNFDLRSGTVSAIITGNVGADKTTAGTVTLTRDNTYTGATDVAAGTLVVQAPNALGTTGTGTTVTAGATLQIDNTAVAAEPVALNGNGVGGAGALVGTGTASLAGPVTLATASTIGVPAAVDSLTLSGTIEGAGALSLIGAGTVTFGNTVGATTPLASLTQNAATRLRVNGGLVRTAGDQTYNGLVTTGGAATLRTTANGNISAPGAFSAVAGTLTLDTGAGNATLLNTTNDFGTVQVTSGGAVSLVDANSIAIGGASMQSLFARARSGNLTLDGPVAATGNGDSIVLVASGNFVNHAGAGALDSGPGRFLVYSTNPTLDTRGGIAYDFKQYGATFGVTPVADSGDGFLYTVSPTATPGLTGTVTKVYDATTAATLTAANYSFAGAIDGDVIDLGAGSLSGTYDTANVGTNKLVSVAGLTLAGPGAHNGTARVYGYQLGSTAASANVGAITAAPLTITANNQAKTYGDAFTFNGTEFAASGLQGGQTVGSVVLASAGAAATANVAGSPYAITAGGASGGSFTPSNYTITYANGQMTVSPAPLTVTANDQVKAYGGSAFVFAGTEFTSIGLRNADAIASVTLTSAGAAPTATVAGSPYPIVPSAATGAGFTPGNYAITYVNGVFTVNPAGAPLVITARNQTKTYGSTFLFNGTEFTATGLQNNETIGQVALASAGAAPGAHVAGGPYAITATGASGGTFTPGNYSITYVPGQLTVNRAALVLIAQNQNKTYGTELAFGAGDYTLTGLKNNETTGPIALASAGTAANATVTGGPYAITPSIGNGGTYTPGDYAVTLVPGQLAVLRAPLAIQAEDQSRRFGAPNPPFSATYSGFRLGETSAVLGGELLFQTPATSGSAPGNYPIVPFGQSGSNYAINFLEGTLSVRPSLLGVPAGLADDAIIGLSRLGASSLRLGIVNCLGEDIAAPSMLALNMIGFQPPRNCSPNAVETEGDRKSAGE